MTPYYQDSLVTLYHGDARELVPSLGHFDAIITDPVWPNSVFPNVSDPEALLFATLNHADADRVVVHLGCDSDPRFLGAIPERWPFLRVCELAYAMPNPKGRILYGGDIAYAFGPAPQTPARSVIPGRIVSGRVDRSIARGTWSGKDKRYTRSRDGVYETMPHPSPRRPEHVRWLVKWFGGSSVLDPFIGSGTTAVACKALGIPCVGIDIEAKYLDLAISRLLQETLELAQTRTGAIS